jgi:mannan endo-1,4-beta-mannosidase
MVSTSLRRRAGFLLCAATALLGTAGIGLGLVSGSAQAATSPGSDFVTQQGAQLELDGQPFRFGGANVEWLGLVGYGPLNFEPGQSERFPTHYEINNALATAKEMGANVIRAQTLGDTVGCGNCLEPTLGHYNPAAFRVMDYAIMRAKHYGIRLILEFQGDSRALNGGNTSSVFSNWLGGKSFWTDPSVIAAFEAHIKAVMTHVNSYTGVAYNDDPTILGWMDCNGCGDGGGSDAWVKTIGDYIHSLSPHQLTMDNAALLEPSAAVLADPDINAYSSEVYPHWVPLVDGNELTGQDPVVGAAAAATARAGKVWFASEYGWDRTDWATPAALNDFLTSMNADPNISGYMFWSLEGQANGHGWTPIPADSNCTLSLTDDNPPIDVPSLGTAGCVTGEDGSWWAMYYTGVATASNTAADMAQRAQIIRTDDYGIRSMVVPPHMIPPAPVITRTADGTLYWEGSAGASDYSIEQAHRSGSGQRARVSWRLLCDHCVTDSSPGWPDGTSPTACFEVIAYNLDGAPGPASAPAGPGCARLVGRKKRV